MSSKGGLPTEPKRKELITSLSISLAVSFIFICMGIQIPLSWSFLLIVIISLAVSRIDNKLTCLAYVLAIVFILDEALILLGLKKEYFKIAYIEMIYLVGLLHSIEGILTFIFGGNESAAIVTYRGEEVAGGYQAYGKWFIPLLLFSIEGIYIPIVAAIIYSNESFVLAPKSKARIMGGLIFTYGLIIIGLAFLTHRGILPLLLSMAVMPMLHEVLFNIDSHIEKRKLLYPYPKQGVRVMSYERKTQQGMQKLHMIKQEEELKTDISSTGVQKGKKNHVREIKYCIEKGDIILEVNDIRVNSEEEYLIAREGEKIKLLIQKLAGDMIEIYYSYEELHEMNIVFLPPI